MTTKGRKKPMIGGERGGGGGKGEGGRGKGEGERGKGRRGRRGTGYHDFPR